MTLDNKYENNIIMNKENLQTKVEALEANVEVKRNELGVAMSEAQVAREELADAGKPVISESVAADLVEQLAEVFSDIVQNVDTSDLSPEFGLSYNEIYLEGLDMSHIGVSDHDIQAVLEEFFTIEEDKDDFVNEDDSGKVDGKFV